MTEQSELTTNITPYSAHIKKSLTPCKNPVNSVIYSGGVTKMSLACFSSSKNYFIGSLAITSGRLTRSYDKQ